MWHFAHYKLVNKTVRKVSLYPHIVDLTLIRPMYD